MLDLLESLKSILGRGEHESFHRRITSLESNLVYWNKRLTHESASERQEAAYEIKRCAEFMRLVEKDLRKVERKHDEQQN